jgi:hypothetical protein
MLEMEQFLSHHLVDVCLLKGTHLESGRALRFAKYFCHRTDRPNQWGITAMLVRRSIDHLAVQVSDLKHLEATAYT